MKYSVRFIQYAGIISDYQSTFDFQIICPTLVVNSSLTKPTSEINFYDVANPNASKIRAPQVALEPGVCFSVTDYELTFKDKPAQDFSTFITIITDKSAFQVQTNDR